MRAHHEGYFYTKEWLAEFYLVDARDLNEALQIAEKIPAARVALFSDYYQKRSLAE